MADNYFAVILDTGKWEGFGMEKKEPLKRIHAQNSTLVHCAAATESMLNQDCPMPFLVVVKGSTYPIVPKHREELSLLLWSIFYL